MDDHSPDLHRFDLREWRHGTMMKRLRPATMGATAMLLFGIVLGDLAGGAHAAGIPTSNVLAYAGVLTDPSGAPLMGTKRIRISLYDKPTPDGAMQCTVGPEMKTLVAGGFQSDLSTCAKAVSANPDLWIEVTIDDVSLGRSKLGAVPFALEAGHSTASNSASAAAGPLETRIAALEASLAEVRSGLGVLVQTGTAGGSYAQADRMLHMGSGIRTWSKRIAFAQPFAKVPQVILGISHLDVDHGFNTRVDAAVTAVDAAGFTLSVQAWSDTVLYATTVNWTAFVK
jgi:hypothetical protein